MFDLGERVQASVVVVNKHLSINRSCSCHTNLWDLVAEKLDLLSEGTGCCRGEHLPH